jgi:hypothetical protein
MQNFSELIQNKSYAYIYQFPVGRISVLMEHSLCQEDFLTTSGMRLPHT